MARYCFYCGRELAAGDRCHCKDPSKDGASASAGSSRQKNASQSTDTGNPSFAYQTAGAAAGTSYGSASAGSKTRSSTKTRHARSSWGKKKTASGQGFAYRLARLQHHFKRITTFFDQVRTLFPNISSGFASSIQYVTRPASKIRQESMRVKRSYSYVNIGVFALLTGVLALLMSRSDTPMFSSMISIVFGDGKNILFTNPVLSFVGLSVLSLLFVLAICVSFFIAARFSNRKPTFRKVMDLVAISLVYMEIMEVIVMISIFLGNRGSLSLILISILLMGVTHLLSFRSALNLSEDTVFFFLIFVYVFCYILFKLLLYLAARVLFIA